MMDNGAFEEMERRRRERSDETAEEEADDDERGGSRFPYSVPDEPEDTDSK